jgi:hypothetical protein
MLAEYAFEYQIILGVKITFHDVLFLYYVRKGTHLKSKNERKRLKIATGRFILTVSFIYLLNLRHLRAELLLRQPPPTCVPPNNKSTAEHTA